MEQTKDSRPVRELIEQYNRELMALYRQQAPASEEEDARRFEEQYPLPQALQEPPVAAAADEAPPHGGFLQVFVFTGNEAEPLPGARITVTRDGQLYANTVTDRSGLTPSIPLPSVDPALTLQPGNVQPYVTYDIRVSAPGFSTVLFENVPVYGGNGVTQPAALLPLVPGDNGDIPRVFRSDGPTRL